MYRLIPPPGCEQQFAQDGPRDVVFVPVAVNYDRVLEDRMLTSAANTEPGKKQIAKFPKRRLLGEEGLDAMMLFLCSDEARFITGAVLPVDGGTSINIG